jgi:GDP-D-mannose dehydratase
MRVLITGITGFVGSGFADYLLKNIPDVKIYASRRWRSRDENIQHLFGDPRVIFMEADLMDRGSLQKLLEESKPDYIFHFAAQSFPWSSFFTPVYTLTTNIIGSTNLFEEIRIARDRFSIDPIIINVSSSEVFGMPEPSEIPIKETNPIRAANPYSISKIGQDYMGQYYYKAYGLKVITTRLFSHEGRRRGKHFALSSFAYQIVLHEKGRYDKVNHIPLLDGFDVSELLKEGWKPIQVGNLDSIRTYSHLEDSLVAYWLVATRGKVGEVYNIGGDYTCSIRDALENLLSKSTIPRNQFKIVINPNLVRPTDITLQIPCSDKFREATGWKPTKTFDDITGDLLLYWREMLQ